MSAAADFMASAPARLEGNSPWASRYAAELRRVVHETAANAPRSLQDHLGPSELGQLCSRQVAGKLAQLPATNHVASVWPSVVGTAVHSWLADAFTTDNARHGLLRWATEQRVTPFPGHPGTADLYDGAEQAVVDHKILGPTSMSKIRDKGGPPVHYQVQLLLYGIGYHKLGLPVSRIVLAAYPRTAPNLDGLYCWEQEFIPEHAEQLLEEVIKLTNIRKRYAADIVRGRIGLNDVPATPQDDACYFCPFYRPQSAYDNGPGCPGTVTN